MRIITEAHISGGRPSWWRRLGWFVGLWVAGVVTVGVAAEAIRWMLHPG